MALIVLNIFFVFLLLSVSACFSACETAITGFSKPKIHKLAKEGNKKAKIICELQEEIGLVISSILTCNTILNSISVSIATAISINIWGTQSVVYCSIVVSILVVFFAEILPKMYTISRPENFLLRTAYFLKIVFKILRPINNVMGMIANWFLSFFIKKNTAEDEYVSSLEELKGAIDLHKGKKDDIDEEKAMLNSILDLGSVHISKIMVHRKNVTMFSIDDNIDSIISQIMLCPFTRIPLWKDNRDNIVGVLHVKNLLKFTRKNENIKNVDIMSIAHKPWFIPENTDLLYQLQEFKKKREHFAIVVDEYGGFMGVVTLEDIIEEIVGDISDEHDIAQSDAIRKQADGSYIVDGVASVRDFNREVGTHFPGDIAATIAGMVINSIGIIPEVGQVFILFGFKFEILKRLKNRVTLIKISEI